MEDCYHMVIQRARGAAAAIKEYTSSDSTSAARMRESGAVAAECRCCSASDACTAAASAGSCCAAGYTAAPIGLCGTKTVVIITRFSCLEARCVRRQAALKAAKILALVELARSKQDPIKRGHSAQYLYRPLPAGPTCGAEKMLQQNKHASSQLIVT